MHSCKAGLCSPTYIPIYISIVVEVFIIYFFFSINIIMHHSGDVRLPIYEGQREYTVDELVALRINPVSAKVCTVQPTAVYHNHSFR